MTTASGAADFSVSEKGSLVYVPGGLVTGPVLRTLVWVDRDGNEEALAAPPRFYNYVRVSPDGTRVTLDTRDAEDDVSVWDLTRETLTRLTFAAEPDHSGVWTPDSQRIVFSSERDGAENLYWRSADGTGVVERLTESEHEHDPNSVSPDGERLVFTENATGTDDLYTLTLDDERRTEPLIVTEFAEANGEVSPDGRRLAYQSNASGQFEIYVRPFPNVTEGQWQISMTGGTRPLWAPGGGELFYLTAQGVMAVSVMADLSVPPGTPQLVFAGSYCGTGPTCAGFLTGRTYDVAPDGQRFLMIKETGQTDGDTATPQIILVLNWTQELLERVPVP